MDAGQYKDLTALLKGPKRLGGTILDFLLPPRCGNCGKKVIEHGFLCPSCWGELQPLAPPFCACCALSFAFDAGGEDVCGACLQNPPEFDWVRAAVSYDELGRSLVMRLKYGGTVPLVPVMGRMMAAAVQDKKIDIVMPVPLHRQRLLARRFNQSGLLAADIGARLGVSVDAFSLVKKRATKSQGGLNRKERFQNVATSFAVEASRRPLIKGKHILLVDDVLTTGATAATAAKVLKRAGAESVGVVAFARVGTPIAG